jgi:alpha-tubulin suppressor-like RCC1 family protein
MPNPTTNFKDNFGIDLGNKLITKEYLMTVYPQLPLQLITPELWIWGVGPSAGGFGSPIGDNTNAISRSTPVTTFAGGANWKQVAGGQYHTAAIRLNGSLFIWGDNTSGQLGDNTKTIRSTPVTTFSGGTDWKQVACGNSYTAAIKTDGTLWNWGDATGLGSNLGHNLGIVRCTPITTFAGGTNWKQVSCGSFHTAAIKTDGTLWLWGQNAYGNLGDNTSIRRSTPVTTFLGGNNWKQVSCAGATNSGHTAAIKTDGTLWTWGSNGSGQLGDNTAVSRSTPVTTFAGGTNWKQVACGSANIAAIKTDGTLWIWGGNGQGQIGNNLSATSRSTPVTTFAGGTNWKQVACGGANVAAIKTDGTLWTWGQGSDGKLGNNTTDNRSVPVTTFAGGTNWKQVACGEQHVIAIKTSDDLQGI